MLFEKKHEYLICMDSDGTVMDTMTIKHIHCFGPSFIDIFNIPSHHQEILDEWNKTNLYSKKRGINRFQGLAEIIGFVKKFGYTFTGSEEYIFWVNNTKEFSIDSLKKEAEKQSNNFCLNMAITWSDEVNRRIKNLPPPQPFDNVVETINKYHDQVDFLGVSSANKDAVYEEWKNIGIFDYCCYVACQDVGKKDVIIARALEQGYESAKVIMLGDAIGDVEAAKKNNVWFFPIIPKKEAQSWANFEKEGIVRLMSGNFDSEYQNSLLKEFYDNLL